MKKMLVLLLCLGLCGCALNAAIARGKLTKLKIGMAKEEVINLMGNPIQVEAYQFKPGVATEFLLYRIEYNYPNETLIPLCFENGILQGWGRNFYDNAIKVKSETKQDIDFKIR